MRLIVAIFIACAINSVTFASEKGKLIYTNSCKNCHAPDVSKAINAPAAFDKKIWDIRFKKAAIEVKENPNKYKSTMDYMLAKVKNGKGLMYHGGLCKESNIKNINCSDEALIEAISFMSKR
jgi:cytochrome c5